MSLELGVAIAAVAVSAIALVATFGAWRMVRSLRRDQQEPPAGEDREQRDEAEGQPLPEPVHVSLRPEGCSGRTALPASASPSC